MTKARRAALWWLVVWALLVAGCGGSGTSLLSHHASQTGAGGAPAQTLPPLGAGPLPAPPATGIPADSAAVEVIKGWSSALRRGDVPRAASYFARPSELLNGQVLFTIRTLAQAEAANETLPCGAKFVSADQRGPYVNVLFALTGRSGPGGGSCGSGTGQTARTNFLVSDGHILAWIRAPDDPGDNGTPGLPPGSGGTPAV